MPGNPKGWLSYTADDHTHAFNTMTGNHPKLRNTWEYVIDHQERSHHIHTPTAVPSRDASIGMGTVIGIGLAIYGGWRLHQLLSILVEGARERTKAHNPK